MNTPPSFSSAAKQTQVSTTVDEKAFGGSIGNPIAADIYGQPQSYGGFVHQQNSYGTVSRDHASWYSTDDQPPSVGTIRPGVISQPSGNNQIYGDGQPPSLNDFDRRDTSQTGASAGRQVPEEYEFAGMSLTGNNFRKFHPDAFFKGNDGK